MPSQYLNRREFLGNSAAGFAAAAATESATRPSGKPNVIVFFTDQQRWDSLGVNGSPMELTPHLDEFARSGVRFDRAFCAQPVCAPSRSTMQTGKYPTGTGVIHNGLALKDDEQTLAHFFKQHGYQTGYIGKWHLGGTGTEPVPVARRGGYDEWWTASDAIERTSHPYEGHVFDANNKPIEFSKKYRVDFLTDLAVDFVRQKKDKPFFLYLSYLEPHHQNDEKRFVAPNGYADRYRNTFQIPRDLAPFPGDWKSQLPDYYGIIARIDECFARLRQELAAQKVDGNTIIVFASDHGCHFKTRNTEYKRSCHEASIHVPLIFHGPGFDSGRVVDRLVSLVDVAPTLLDAIGIDTPETMHGRSLLGLAQGRQTTWRSEVMVQMREEALQRALRTDRWKYCIYNPDSERNEPHSAEYVERFLYDLSSDPHEHVNLIGRPDFRNIANELQGRLIEQMTAAGEPRPKITPARHYA